MTRVAIVARTAARGHLEALVASQDALVVAAAAPSVDALVSDPALASAEVVLLHATTEIGAREVGTMPPIPIVVLTGRRVPPSALASMFAAGVRGILPDDASGDEIAAAIDAVVAGLAVVPPEILSDVVSDGRRDFAAAQRRSSVAAPPLTPREREILSMVAEGLPNKLIAARLAISEHTVKTHLEATFEKLGASTRAEAVAIGVRSGLLLL